MAQRNKDRIYIPDLDKDLVQKLQLKLRHELFVGLKEKYEIVAPIKASGNSIGSFTVSYKSPKRKTFAIHIRHIEKASFEIEMTSDIRFRSRVEFSEIRNQFHALIEFLNKI